MDIQCLSGNKKGKNAINKQKYAKAELFEGKNNMQIYKLKRLIMVLKHLVIRSQYLFVHTHTCFCLQVYMDLCNWGGQKSIFLSFSVITYLIIF